MKIKEINIKYIKGIQDKTFKLNLIPNKPNIFVAQNGFGKSFLNDIYYIYFFHIKKLFSKLN